MATVAYPYDPNGNNPANLVVGERQVLTQINNDAYRYLIPDFAPFYQTNFSAKGFDGAGNVVALRVGVDFQFSMRFIGATRANGSVVNAAISVINKNIQGPITLSYQTLGGQFAANRNYVIQTIAQNNYNPRKIAWDQVTNLPPVFPPSGHAQDLDTFTGLRDLIDAIDRIKVAAANTDSIRNELRQHTLNVSDPHHTLALLPSDLVRRPELELHTKDFRDPHHTLDLLPTDIVRTAHFNNVVATLTPKTDFDAHTTNFSDPHKTLTQLPADLVRQPQLTSVVATLVTKTDLQSQFDARNIFLTTKPTEYRTDVVFVSQPHMRSFVWNPGIGGYDRAPWHRPAMLQYSYVNPSSIYGWLLVEPGTVHNQAMYPDLTAALGLSGVGTFQLVDMRGNFLRVLDNGRAKDINRANLSYQASATARHNHYLPTTAGLPGPAFGLFDYGTSPTGGSNNGPVASPWFKSAINQMPEHGEPPVTTFPNPLFAVNNPGYDPSDVGNYGKFEDETRVDNNAVPLWISI